MRTGPIAMGRPGAVSFNQLNRAMRDAAGSVATGVIEDRAVSMHQFEWHEKGSAAIPSHRTGRAPLRSVRWRIQTPPRPPTAINLPAHPRMHASHQLWCAFKKNAGPGPDIPLWQP